MMEDRDWNKVATPALVTAKQMILICLSLEIVIGFVFVLLAQRFDIPTNDLIWWVLQIFGVVVSTNLGAVILAVIAQKNVNDLGRVYREVFTADFYQTLHSMSAFRSFVEREAENDGRTFDGEMEDLAVKMYRIARAHIDVKANELEPMEAFSETASDEELFAE